MNSKCLQVSITVADCSALPHAGHLIRQILTRRGTEMGSPSYLCNLINVVALIAGGRSTSVGGIPLATVSVAVQFVTKYPVQNGGITLPLSS